MKELRISEDGIAHAERTVAQAYKAMAAAVGLLERRLDRARAAQEDLDNEELVREVKAVNAAFQLAIQQEGKARDAGSQRYGSRSGGQLDLDAARAEIGRRLACLRAAGAGGDLSRGAE